MEPLPQFGARILRFEGPQPKYSRTFLSEISSILRCSWYTLSIVLQQLITLAAKGSAIEIMDKSAYIQEGDRQLNDTHFYEKVFEDQTG